jgi:RNA polymerase sigma factor (sigma-70 family)
MFSQFNLDNDQLKTIEETVKAAVSKFKALKVNFDLSVSSITSEVIQEVQKKFNPKKGTIQGFAYTIAYNKAIDMHKDLKKRGEVESLRDFSNQKEAASLKNIPLSNHSVGMNPIARQVLFDALNELPADDKDIIEMKFLISPSMKHKEIAQELGLSTSNVKVRLLRARRKLKSILAKKGYKESDFF